MLLFQNWMMTLTRRDLFEAQGLLSKPVDKVTQPLPGHHLNQRVAHEIGVLGVYIACLDVGQRMRKLCGWGVWEPKKLARNRWTRGVLNVRKHHV